MSFNHQPFTNAQYLTLGSFRKTGVRVDTPVWFTQDGELFYACSNNQAGKVKRLKNSGRCQIAPCTMTGTPTGDWQDGEATILNDEKRIALAHRALRKKYGWKMWLLDSGACLSGRIKQRAYICIRSHSQM